MKTVRNIVLVIIFGALVALCLVFAPNYIKKENPDKTNLVINYTNVTTSMKGKVIIQDDDIYLCKEDIENYYDRYIYYDKQYNYIIAAANDKIACFDISAKTVDINGSKSSAKIIEEDGTYYIPMTKLQELYNIKVDFKKDNNTVVIDSLDRKLETATTKKKVNVKYKKIFLSKTVAKLEEGSKVAIVPNQASLEWTLIRCENGELGYIKKQDLTETKIEREEQIKEPTKKISLAWEYFSEYGKAPKMEEGQKYEGINVVSPSFFYMDSYNVRENVEESGQEYIKWAKSNNYEVWAMVSNNNDTTEKMDDFSNWINDYEKRQQVISQILNYVKKYDLDGINIDFENIYLKDKQAFSRFIIELKPQLKNVGATLSVDVTEPDGSDNWSLCFDRNLIGRVSDYIVFMAYDQYGKSSKTAGPTAAYYWVDKNISKFINQEEVEVNKIILGIPLYTLLWKENNGELKADAIPQKNIKIPEGVQTTWLSDSKQKYMEYELNGTSYKMWIEDKQATEQKLELLEKYNLAGAAFWQKGFEDESIWPMVKEKIK